MITVVVPTLNSEPHLVSCLAALVPGVTSGLIAQLVIVDGGSSDNTLTIAEEAGADIVRTERGRGQQLAAGAAEAKAPWLLFLHADTLLESGWEQKVRQFLEEVRTSAAPAHAACFRFRLNDRRLAARLLEGVVSLRCAVFRLPYGDQGLLISRQHYDEVGGFSPIPLMEDVDLVVRIGRSRLSTLRHAAVTSADRYRRDGYLRRVITNAGCLTLWFLGVSPDRIERLYR